MTYLDPYCDCGTCCNACGHDDDCTSHDVPDTDPQQNNHDAYTL